LVTCFLKGYNKKNYSELSGNNSNQVLVSKISSSYTINRLRLLVYIVHSINVNPAGGAPKHPVKMAVIGKNNVLGDKQNDLEYHGGPTRAVSLFSLERILALQKEGHPINPGSTGENITIKGLNWDLMKVGVRFRIGEAEIELTGPAPPCKTISKSFEKGSFARISEKKYPGWSRWYASVSKEGIITVNDIVSRI
jgi:MOSC domain-containing protein YiiM